LRALGGIMFAAASAFQVSQHINAEFSIRAVSTHSCSAPLSRFNETKKRPHFVIINVQINF
jgi:hypothetical protein